MAGGQKVLKKMKLIDEIKAISQHKTQIIEEQTRPTEEEIKIQFDWIVEKIRKAAETGLRGASVQCPSGDGRIRRAYSAALELLKNEGFEVRLCGAIQYSGGSMGSYVDCIYWYK